MPLTFSLTLLAATALLLVGCNPILPSEGNKVKFKAHSKSQPATKTAYAGTGSSHEDIYWSEGDDIRIYSGNTAVVTPAFANYELVISSDKTRLFAVAIGTYLDTIASVLNQKAIPALLELNKKFAGCAMPILIHDDIESDNETLTANLEKLCRAGLITPSPDLEEHLREALNLPLRQE